MSFHLTVKTQYNEYCQTRCWFRILTALIHYGNADIPPSSLQNKGRFQDHILTKELAACVSI